MPFTFFAHQALVIPFKWARPRWFDGTALCVGSMAPDFAYALEGTPLAFRSHRIAAQLVWTLPVTLLITKFFRGRVAEPLGVELPGLLGAELRALAQSRRALWITGTSAVLGGLSHVFLDGFTHPTGWAVERCDGLRTVLFVLVGQDVALFNVLQYTGHTLGSALGCWMLWALIVRRQFSRWNELVPFPPRAGFAVGARFWRTIALSVMLALAAAVSGKNIPVAIIRGALVLLAGIALAALVTIPSARRLG